MQGVQIFGVKKSSATRAAERFFKERRTTLQFIDLKEKPMAKGEIQRFISKFGLQGLLDTEGKAYADAGLKYLRLSDTDLMARIEREPLLLRLPLVRGPKTVSIGEDEAAWKDMVAGLGK